MRISNEATTIEIVEHDEGAAHLAERIVRSLGYQPAVFLSEIDFLKRHERNRRGCVLLDYAMPILSGLQVQALLSASGSIRPVIFASGMGTIPVTVAALRAGAVDFVTKPFSKDFLERAIRSALEIQSHREAAIERQRELIRKLGLLTHRERQVLELVVTGRLNKQIAADLGTVEKTIKVHRSRVMAKLDAGSLPELVQLANALGIGLSFGGRVPGERGAPVSLPASRAVPIGMWSWDIQDDRVIADEVCSELFGMTGSGDETPSLAMYMHAIRDEDRHELARVIREAMATGEEFQVTYGVTGLCGVRTVLACGRVLFDSEGMPRRLFVAQVDVTPRAQIGEGGCAQGKSRRRSGRSGAALRW